MQINKIHLQGIRYFALHPLQNQPTMTEVVKDWNGLVPKWAYLEANTGRSLGAKPPKSKVSP